MYLSRLILNPRSRQVRREIADFYEMHRTISQAYPNGTFRIDRRESGAAGVLFRLEMQERTGVPTLLVQSQEPPDWGFLRAPGKDYLLSKDDLPLEVENPAVKPFKIELHAGQELAFRLRANSVVKKDCEGKKQGRRVGLLHEEDQLKWLKRKIEDAGAQLITARTANEETITGKLYRQEERHDLHFLSVQFDGVLQVRDPERLVSTVQAGIGSGKGLGFGLLSLARAAI